MSSTRINLSSTQAANIVLLVVTTAVTVPRLLLPIWTPERRVGWKDGWLIAAFVAYISLAIIYIATMPVIFRIGAIADGSSQVYAGVIQDAQSVLKIVFSTTILHWSVLWFVKLSMLAFYKELIARLRTYTRLWWAVAVITALTFLVNVFQFMFTCQTPSDYFVVGKCLTPAATRLSHVSLWMSFAFDVNTDVMIMLLPLGLIKQARMPLRQKISIGSIFCLALICVAMAAIRVREVGENMKTTSTPSVTWLALWSLVEASIAMIIGCGPGLYEVIRRKTKNSSKGSSNTSRNHRPLGSHHNNTQEYDLADYGYGRGKGDLKGLGDAASSQEELTTHLKASRGVVVTTQSSVQFEKSMGEKQLPELPGFGVPRSPHPSFHNDFGQVVDTTERV
ncbi:hypothetical protein K461DRAFT_268748 [Myriangium duriaei CBS 260.36]|uniref:Rhodopsin domain-containing protein n=1 Tax=Myriangium duriaei CBS 260.36 TaxID=1168546 RepID=A0A9P4IX89_9PEZI|nr:hypothetical protein K461DRAFT_268748 [Myriangium duriaei CBS 260.36]